MAPTGFTLSSNTYKVGTVSPNMFEEGSKVQVSIDGEEGFRTISYHNITMRSIVSTYGSTLIEFTYYQLSQSYLFIFRSTQTLR